MTPSTLGYLTRHFVSAIMSPPLLTDLGVDYLRRTLASVLGILIVIGIFLPRVFFNKYMALNANPYREPYLLAVQADTLMMIAVPMVIVGLLAVVVGPLLFPDEVDYQVLTPLPITRAQLFGAKLLAVTLVVLAAVAAVNLVASVWFPAAIGGRRAVHPLAARMAAHALATIAASIWMFLLVTAVQGISISVLPAAWRRTGGLVEQATLFVTLLLTIPAVMRLPAMTVTRDTVVESPLIWLPPAWFLGVERWLLDGGDSSGYARAAMIAAAMSATALSVLAGIYTHLFWSAERLAGMSASVRGNRRASRRHWFAHVAAPTAAVLSFILSGLARSRLHQFVFLLVIASGAALLVGQIANVIEGATAFAARPRSTVNAVIGAPLLVGLCTTLGLRAAFLLPLDRGAAWIFRVTEDPHHRPEVLDGVWFAFSALAIALPSMMALLLQPAVLGAAWWPCLALTILANLLLVELVVLDWRRIPYACSYLPGKRNLAYSLGVLLAYYFVFIVVGTNLLRWSLLHPSRTLALGGTLLAAWAATRRARVHQWGLHPLEFEDEDPMAVRGLGLASDERS
jgi:hypothetical protein